MNKKKILLIIIPLLFTLFFIINYFFQDPLYFVKSKVIVNKLLINSDKDKDGILDPEDMLEGARKEVENRTNYRSQYYIGGYPPAYEGVCTDVIWRALKNTGYNLKYNMDMDILKNQRDYINSVKAPDPNIDFRRVKNQYVFLKKYAQNLTVEVKPRDIENLKEWQRGDIVVLEKPDHVAVISDLRRRDGVPLVIHNSNTYPKENDRLMLWYKAKRIIGHFRYYK